MDKPMLWEMIKLIGNPSPYPIAVKKSAIRVSKRKVYESVLMTDFREIWSLQGFILEFFMKINEKFE
jgi:hypothetical protein